MKILITGNMGYVGPGLISKLRQSYPDAELIGYDMGYFSKCLTNVDYLPDNKLDKQIFGDVRNYQESIFEGIDSVVYLAAISNDPMGKRFEKVTMDVNYRAAINMAKSAKKHGVKSFVFPSSCSVYGEAGDFPKVETDNLNPLTAYAISKVEAEKGLYALASEDFLVTCFRFGTACGHSGRLRLDLVLNDFVAGSVISKEISILGDGTPWRPLINVLDMARAIDFGISRKSSTGGNFSVMNTGSSTWNYQIVDLAKAVAEVVPGVKVSVNPNAQPDKRSYKVVFDLFEKLAPDYQPIVDLKTTVQGLYSNLIEMNFNDHNYRKSQFIRLEVLTGLQNKGYLTEDLIWNWQN